MDEMEVDGIPPDGSRLEAEPVLVQCVAPYLELQALQRLRSCSRSLCALLSGGQAGPQDICAQKVPIDHAPGSACRKAFDRWGPRVSSLTVSAPAPSWTVLEQDRTRPCMPAFSAARLPPSPSAAVTQGYRSR